MSYSHTLGECNNPIRPVQIARISIGSERNANNKNETVDDQTIKNAQRSFIPLKTTKKTDIRKYNVHSQVCDAS